MLRAILIYLSRAAWARKIVTNWNFARRAASRFIAGETLDDAIRVIKDLNLHGMNATLDHLGEHTSNESDAVRATEDILVALDAIEQSNVRANLSIKLTQIGLALSPSLCADNLRRILSRARDHHNFVRMDMEDSPWVDQTLDLCLQMYTDGFDNTGVVIQSYLYRSAEDVARLLSQSVKIRLCKGAYDEPPEIAFPSKKDVDANYDRLAEILFDSALSHGAELLSPNGRIPPLPAIASHDPKRLDHARSYGRQIGLPAGAIEFQMLYGIRRDLQELTVQEGYPVRIYVPYGTEWYPYYLRRLAERPANLWFFISNFFKA